MDHWLLEQLNQWASTSPEQFNAVLKFSDHAAFILMAALIGGAWFVTSTRHTLAEKRGSVILLLLAFVTAYGLAGILKNITAQPRPLAEADLRVPLAAEEWEAVVQEYNLDEGMPSQHAALTFAMVAVLWTIHRPLAVCMAIIGGLASLTRIAVGLHYPSQTLVGLLLGLTVGAVLIRLVPARLFAPLVRLFDDYPAAMYPLAFLFLYDFSQRFAWVRGLF